MLKDNEDMLILERLKKSKAFLLVEDAYCLKYKELVHAGVIKVAPMRNSALPPRPLLLAKALRRFDLPLPRI